MSRGAVGRAGGGGRGVLGGAAPAAADHVVGAPARARRVCAPAARVGGAAPAPWAAGAGVWQASLERRALGAGGEAAALGALLAEGVAAGALSRLQEAVSMLPVLALARGAGQPLPRRRVAGLEDAAAARRGRRRRERGAARGDGGGERRAPAARGGAARRARARHGRSPRSRASSSRATAARRCRRRRARLGSGAAAAPASTACSATCRARATARAGRRRVWRRAGRPASATRSTACSCADPRGAARRLLAPSAASRVLDVLAQPDRGRGRRRRPPGPRAAGAVELAAWPADVLPALRRRAGLRSWRRAGSRRRRPTTTRREGGAALAREASTRRGRRASRRGADDVAERRRRAAALCARARARELLPHERGHRRERESS